MHFDLSETQTEHLQYCLLTFDGKRFPDCRQFAVSIDGDFVIQQSFVHDEGIELRRICPSTQSHTVTTENSETTHTDNDACHVFLFSPDVFPVRASTVLGCSVLIMISLSSSITYIPQYQ